MKKKILAALICAALALNLTACAEKEEPNDKTSKDKSSKSSVSSVSTPSDSENTGSDSAGNTETSSTAESEPEESKPEEPSKPVGSGIDWDSVPYADEMDFEYKDINGTYGGYEYSGIKISKYTGSEKLIKIPETIEGKPVVVLDGEVFNVYNSDFSVKTPKNLVIIGGYVFYGCRNFTVDISESESEKGSLINSNAFSDCENFSVYMHPKSVTKIYKDAFVLCRQFNSLILADSTIGLNVGFIYSESGIPETTIYKGVTYDNSHYYALIDTVNMGETGMTIEDGVLKRVSRATVGTFTVPDSVTTVKAGAFIDCWDITEIIIPDSVTKIENEAFNSRGDFTVTYKGTAYKPNQLSHLYKLFN